MIFDTNLLIACVRRKELPPVKAVISIVSVGELAAFSVKSDWGIQKVEFMHDMILRYPTVDVTNALVSFYAEIDAFSQGKLKTLPLSSSARNMGKNDIWIAATALYLDMELHTADNDFDHLTALGLRL
ncbi:MAG: PIN domain-containing protein, partial [Pedobacter sp.]